MTAERLTFAGWRSATIDMPGHGRSALFGWSSPGARSATPATRGAQSAAPGRGRGQHIDEALPGEARHHDDPLKQIPASEYLPVLTGVEVSANGRCRCPMLDHEDRHPSATAYGTEWKRFACGAGGSIIDAASAIYGIEPTDAGYFELRDLIVEALEPGAVREEDR